MAQDQKKFLLISPDFPPPFVGGSLVWLINLVENCPVSFDVLTGLKNDNYEEVLSNPNKVIRSSFISDSHNPGKIKLFITYLYMPLWVIINYKRNKYDAILVNPGVMGNSILFWLGFFLRLKVIGAGHGEEITIPLYGKGIKNFIKRFIMKASYKKASGFFVVCHFCKRLLVELKVKEEHIDVIPSCLNKNKINIDPSINRVQNKIITVGRFIERKGFHLLIDAVILLRKEIPNITLDICGTGPMKNQLKKQIQDLKAEDFIRLYDNASDEFLSRKYQEASLFVLAHMLLKNGDTEGCPTVFSEAMGHGLPLIGGTGAGADTAIISGKNGYIVDVRNQEEFVSKIKDILSNKELSEKMIEYGKEKLSNDHDPKKAGIALAKTVERIILGKSAEGTQLYFNEIDKK